MLTNKSFDNLGGRLPMAELSDIQECHPSLWLGCDRFRRQGIFDIFSLLIIGYPYPLSGVLVVYSMKNVVFAN